MKQKITTHSGVWYFDFTARLVSYMLTEGKLKFVFVNLPFNEVVFLSNDNADFVRISGDGYTLNSSDILEIENGMYDM